MRTLAWIIRASVGCCAPSRSARRRQSRLLRGPRSITRLRRDIHHSALDRDKQETIRISLDGDAIDAQQGDTIAAALLRAGVTTFTRSIKYHRPRGPFCLQGTCGQCLMRVDGVPSLPACKERAQESMICERQNAPLGLAESDLFRPADFLFPQGLDHHHLLAQSRLLGRVALEVARRRAGLGELPGPGRPPGAGALRRAK